jgi:penicillin-binding protein 1A
VVAGLLWGLIAAGLVLAVLAWDLPRPSDAVASTERRPGVVVLAEGGAVIGRLGEHYGETLKVADVPAHLVQAVLATEDRRFREHGGFDLPGIARAAWVNLRQGGIVQGGSTLSQQVAKTLFLSNARTWRRKGQEVLLTLWLEQHFTKDEILGIWLNRVYLGSGAFGMDAAARLYFGVSARRVNLFQAALLAGLPKAPSKLNPHADPRAAIDRTRAVLGNLVETGAIRPETAAQALAAGQRAGFRHDPGASAFAAFAAEEAASIAGLPPAGDLRLLGTLDVALQVRAARALSAALARHPSIEGAVVVLEAGSGAIRAMVGGVEGDQFNRAAAARRQPGSAFKPVVWLAALEHGAAPSDIIDDRPLSYGSWRPRNYNDRYLGRITLAEALAQSSNSVAVQLFQRAGSRRVGDAARRLGLAAPVADATAALGTGSVTPLALAAAYAAIANGGFAVTPYAVGSVTDAGGRMLWRRAQPVPRRVIDAGDAETLAAMLRGAVETGTGRAAAIPGRVVAGKTGTTSDSRDAWFAGFSGGLVVVVWIGADDNAPMPGLTGGGLPAQVFREVLSGR